ncbi:ABC transporter-like, partial [Trinorchestia longiramus]
RVLIQNSTITLSFGRRYALIGRNGLGKTTLLRMIAAGVLRIPAHISVLHVEQEVTADDTSALESVLQCDTVRHGLLQEEKELQQRIAAGDGDTGLSDRLATVYAELQAIEADKAPAKASVILCGLGFTREMQQQATKKFSGGWRMRIALARALFTQPDLLLLDEPTNMLDLKAIIWLETYLVMWPTTLLLVSHDRHFLDAVPTDVLHLHSRAIQSYRGNYENFMNTRTERLKNQQREYDSQMQFRAHVQEFIDKFRYNAKRASLVQSKIKMLEKLPELQPVEKETVVVFTFPDVEKLSPPILQLDEVSFRYSKDGPIIFQDVNISTTMTSRTCIVGDNGAGKTTLLKILLGELSPTKGQRFCNRQLRIGYFSQHHVDQLDLRLSGVTLLQQRFPGKPVEEYRRQLGRFGVSGDLALQQLASLSGGQKSRVAFAAMAAASPSFLILDEPTNHLDIETIEALGEAIKLYKGGVVLVSHDERLIRQVCTELWLCGNNTVRSIEGGFDAYRKLVETEI